MHLSLLSAVALAVIAPSIPHAVAAQQQQQQQQQQRAASSEIAPGEVAYGARKARTKAKGAIRLSAYNVENLFDQKDDPANPYDQDEMTSKARLESLARAIRELDADILCLEEIESKECLEWFRDTYLKGLGYDYLESLDNGYNRGIEQSVLSRVPIVSAKIYSGEDLVISDMESRRTPDEAKRLGGEWAKPGSKLPERFQRSPLRVQLKTKDGYELTVFVVHLKAGADFDHQRELEALQVEAWVGDELKRNPDANVAVLGDFNGMPNDMNVKALRISELGLVSAYDWRGEKDAPRNRYATHASGRSIDFIVMTPGLAADAVNDSYFVLGTPHAGSAWDWRKAKDNPPPPSYASDHYPVSIEIATATDKPASAFKRATKAAGASDSVGDKSPPRAAPKDAPSKSEQARSATNKDASGPRPVGDAPAADRALAAELRGAGWTYILPEPKSKAAKWGNTDTRTTWFPGYWKNERSNATSETQPAKPGFTGDGKDKPKWRDGGSPGPVSWVEWLCSAEGAEKK